MIDFNVGSAIVKKCDAFRQKLNFTDFQALIRLSVRYLGEQYPPSPETAVGYLLKGCDSEEMTEAIRRAAGSQ